MIQSFLTFPHSLHFYSTQNSGFRAAQSLYTVMEGVLFVTMLLFAIITAMSLLALELSNALSLETLDAFFDTILMVGLVLGYCYLSECVTSDLLEVGDIFYNSAWYHLPAKQKRLLVVPIGRAQNVFRLKCLGFVDCSLTVFSSVSLFSPTHEVFEDGQCNWRELNLLFLTLADSSNGRLVLHHSSALPVMCGIVVGTIKGNSYTNNHTSNWIPSHRKWP